MDPLQLKSFADTLRTSTYKMKNSDEREAAALEAINLTSQHFDANSKVMKDLIKGVDRIKNSEASEVDQEVNSLFRGLYLSVIDANKEALEKKRKAEERDKEIKAVVELQREENLPRVTENTHIERGESALVATSSMRQVRALVEQQIKQGVDPEKIVVSFDFDWLLSAKIPMSGTMAPGERSEKLKGSEEGAKDTLDFLAFIRENRIKACIVTSGSVTKVSHGLRYILNQNVNDTIFARDFRDKEVNDEEVAKGVYKPIREKTADGVSLEHLHGIVTVIGNPLNKHEGLSFLLDRANIKPELILHLDDASANSETMYNKFTEKRIPIISVLMPVDPTTPAYELEPIEGQTLKRLKGKWKH